MMNTQITLDLPESIIEQARTIAKQEGRTVDDILVDLIEHGITARDVHLMLYPTETPYGNEEAARIMQDMLRSSTLPKVINKQS